MWDTFTFFSKKEKKTTTLLYLYLGNVNYFNGCEISQMNEIDRATDACVLRHV